MNWWWYGVIMWCVHSGYIVNNERWSRSQRSQPQLDVLQQQRHVGDVHTGSSVYSLHVPESAIPVCCNGLDIDQCSSQHGTLTLFYPFLSPVSVVRIVSAKQYFHTVLSVSWTAHHWHYFWCSKCHFYVALCRQLLSFCCRNYTRLIINSAVM